MKKVYLPLVILFFSLNVFAQNWGYVVTVNNDTIRCAKIKSTFIGNFIKYKATDKDDFKTVKTDDIKEYQLSNDSAIWRAEILKPGGKPYFVCVEADGKICLYQQIIVSSSGYTTTTTTNWFVSKDHAPLIALKTNALFVFGASHDDRKAALADMFTDNPQVATAYKALNNHH
jgi:hypothetical protein